MTAYLVVDLFEAEPHVSLNRYDTKGVDLTPDVALELAGVLTMLPGTERGSRQPSQRQQQNRPRSKAGGGLYVLPPTRPLQQAGVFEGRVALKSGIQTPGLDMRSRSWSGWIGEKSGAAATVVQARLRHASAKTTLDIYGHL